MNEDWVAELRQYGANVRELIEHLKSRSGSTQTVIHRNDNGGLVVGVCITACVATVVLMLSSLIVENRSYQHFEAEMKRMDDRYDARIAELKAWSDVHAQSIARLQAAQKEK